MSLRVSIEKMLVFVVAPCHKSFFDALVNVEDEITFLNRLDSLNNVLVLDYGQTEYNDDEYFDITHLNYKGAKRFSEQLKEDLIKHEIL